jgi:hypothetical protein
MDSGTRVLTSPAYLVAGLGRAQIPMSPRGATGASLTARVTFLRQPCNEPSRATVL